MSTQENACLSDALERTETPEKGGIAITFAVVTRKENNLQPVAASLTGAADDIIETLEKKTGLNIPINLRIVPYETRQRDNLKNLGDSDYLTNKMAVVVDLSCPPEEIEASLKKQMSAIKYTLGHELFHLSGHPEGMSILAEFLGDAFSAELSGKEKALQGFQTIFPNARYERSSDATHPSQSDRLQALQTGQYASRVKNLLQQVKDDTSAGKTQTWPEALRDKFLGEQRTGRRLQ